MKHLFISLISNDEAFTDFFYSSTPILGPFQIGTHYTTPEAQKMCRDCSDILVIYLLQPEFETLLETLTGLKKSNPEVSILLIGTALDSGSIKEVIQAGVEGILYEREIGVRYSKALNCLSKSRKFLSDIYITSLISEFKINLNDRVLSRREISILEKLSDGNTYSEISEELFISYFTTKNHLTHIYRKLNVRNREEALFKARELKLIN